MRLLLTFAILLLLHNIAKCMEPIAIALYDVGKLYDTIPSSFYNDKAYTPKGKNRWNTDRYNRKVENIVSVIDSMRMPIVALSGVENEQVVRDIVMRSNQDYSYTHRTTDYYDGLDFALLYYADQLFIDRVATTAQTTIISGEIDNKTISIHLTRVGSRLRSIKPLDSDTPSDITVAWGRLTRDDLNRLEMEDLTRKPEQRGGGDTKGEYGWIFKNRLGVVSTEEYTIESGVYITKWLLTTDLSAPLATFTKGRYYGGYSNLLPLYLYINTTSKGGD